MLVSLYSSVNSHVRVMVVGHVPLVTVTETLVTLVVPQVLVTEGVPKSQTEPYATVKLVGHDNTKHDEQ
jgi:hypothetical protein